MPPVQPMLAKAVKGVPDPAKFDPDGTYDGLGLSFEPKWDLNRPVVYTSAIGRQFRNSVPGSAGTQRPAAASELSMRATFM